MTGFWTFMLVLFCTPFGWVGLALLTCLTLAIRDGGSK